MRNMKRFLILCLIFSVSLGCNFTRFLTPEPATEPEATRTSASDVFPSDTPFSSQTPAADSTQEAAQELVTLDPCTLLTREEAAAILGEAMSEAKINGGACTYADEASAVHVISAYAFQGEQAKNQWGARLFLLGAFGLQIDQPAVDEIKALDEAGDQKAILEKVSALSADSTAFTSRSLDGLGEIAYWAWKDLGYGVRQGFLVAVKGDVIAGTDMVHGESLDEKAAVDGAMQAVSRVFERLPERFTLSLVAPATQAITATPTLISTPTLVPVLPTPTEIGGGSRLIAFESDQDGDQQIFAMDLEGGNFKRLTYTGANFAPAWSPDGKLIAFYSIRGSTASLHVMNADGSGERILFDSAFISGGPGWSPDGARIVFVSKRDSNLEIYGISPDGSGLVNVTNNPADDFAPAWSPSGNRIAFTSNRGGTTEVWVMKADGSEIVQVTHFGTVASEPAWSPDGKLLAFAGSVDGGQYGQIFTIRPDGTELVNLTNNNNMDNRAPEWSPDGVFILFYAAGFQGNWDIYRMNFNGSNPINLTQAHSTHESFPDWQP